MSRRYVAFADVLGFKALVAEADHQTLGEKYEQFRIGVETAVAHGRVTSGNNGTVRAEVELATVNMLMVSDSIFFWTDATGAAEFTALVITVGKLLVAGFSQGFPIRAGLVVGDLSTSQVTYPNGRLAASPIWGKGLVDATELEKDQLWSGAVIEDDAVREYHASLSASPGIPALDDMGHIVRYEVPFRHRPRELFTVPFVRFNRSGVQNS